MTAPVLLLTRPEPAARRFAALWRDRFGEGIAVMISPLTAIMPTGAPVPPAEEVIFTSENAVGLAGAGAERTAWCVGPRTAAAARAAGFTVRQGPGDAAGLTRQIIAERVQEGLLLHLRGDEQAFAVTQTLRAAGIAAQDLILYHQHSLPLTEAAHALLSRPGTVLVPVFSGQSAARLAAVLPVPCAARLLIAAISATAARQIPAAQATIAPHPDAEGMLSALRHLATRNHAG